MYRSVSLKLIFMLMSLFLYSQHAAAACIQNPRFMNLQFTVPNRTFSIMYDDITVKDLDTIVIPYGTGPMDTNASNGRDCGTTDLHGRFVNGWTPVNNFAPTNIPGISMAVLTGANTWFNFFIPGRNPPNWNITDTQWRIVIRKTGRITQAGTLTSGRVAQLYQTNTRPTNSTWYLTTLNMSSNAIRINVLSCSTKSKTYNIDMGDWNENQFKNINDTSTPVAIPVVLTCMAGTNIKATITSNAGYVDETTGKLKLFGNNSATGIAIQLLDKNSNPIRLNYKNNLQDNVPNGDYLFNWKARYIQTAPTITPGVANSTAVVNILYE
ncbi:fimbrial protein [Providencia alcalifaciens]|uniref:fimbrial protein n=1 Tax=Providencia alcalifaciens TaxID=126385 RepID=UPI001CC6F0C9|nr:fimbrial protein [Providencia alcalifaciens]CAG9407764.1 hypothetical protein NVI2019_GHJFPKLH_00265 [Providencia alcalifaciens]